MSAAILDHKRNPSVSQTRVGPPGPVLAANIATATSTTPMQNRSERVTRSGPPGYNLASTDDLTIQPNC